MWSQSLSKFWKQHWLCCDELQEKTTYLSHEAPRNLSSLVGLSATILIPMKSCMLKFMTKPNWFFEPWNRFRKRRNLARPPQCSGSFLSYWRNYQTFSWYFSQISVDILSKWRSKINSKYGRWGYHKDTDDYRKTVETLLVGQQSWSQRSRLSSFHCLAELKLERSILRDMIKKINDEFHESYRSRVGLFIMPTKKSERRELWYKSTTIPNCTEPANRWFVS